MRIVPDKSWIDIPRIQRWRDSRYKDGINTFIQYALADPRNLDSETIYCPCSWCKNLELVNKSDLAAHLVSGFYEEYKYWTFHGEGCLEEMDLVADTGTSDDGRVDDTRTMFADMLPIPDIDETEDVDDAEVADDAEEVNDPRNWARMMKLIEDNEKDLYEGCTEFTKLSFMLRLLHIKTLSGMADKYFDMLLKLLRKVIPKGEESIPSKYSKAKKIVSTLGLDYNKIDACPNDCILYYKDNKDLNECPTCGLSRWVQRINHSTQRRTEGVLKQKKIPAKVLRHFPLIPRLQRLYMNKDTARSMRWHMEERIDDGKVRHPADAEAWKHVDRTFPWFAKVLVNVNTCMVFLLDFLGQEPFKKKGRKASELKKKLPPNGFRAILRWERNQLPTGEWANPFTSYIGCLARRSDYANPFFEPEQLPFHSLERVYRDCWVI